MTQPDVVMVELCNSRLNILQLDEEKLLQEAQDINLDKIRLAVKQVPTSLIIYNISLRIMFEFTQRHFTQIQYMLLYRPIYYMKNILIYYSIYTYILYIGYRPI